MFITYKIIMLFLNDVELFYIHGVFKTKFNVYLIINSDALNGTLFKRDQL